MAQDNPQFSTQFVNDTRAINNLLNTIKDDLATLKQRRSELLQLRDGATMMGNSEKFTQISKELLANDQSIAAGERVMADHSAKLVALTKSHS